MSNNIDAQTNSPKAPREASIPGLIVAVLAIVVGIASLCGPGLGLAKFCSALPFLAAGTSLGIRSLLCIPDSVTGRRLPFLRGLACLFGGLLFGCIPMQFLALIAAQARAGASTPNLPLAIGIPLVILVSSQLSSVG